MTSVKDWLLYLAFKSYSGVSIARNFIDLIGYVVVMVVAYLSSVPQSVFLTEQRVV